MPTYAYLEAGESLGGIWLTDEQFLEPAMLEQLGAFAALSMVLTQIAHGAGFHPYGDLETAALRRIGEPHISGIRWRLNAIPRPAPC